MFYPYEDLLTSRRHKDDRGRTFLDLKHGDLRVHNVTTIETDQVLLQSVIFPDGRPTDNSPQKRVVSELS